MQVEFSLKDLELDIRYSGKADYIKIDGEFLTNVEAFELAFKLQSASTEIINYLERDILEGLKNAR